MIEPARHDLPHDPRDPRHSRNGTAPDPVDGLVTPFADAIAALPRPPLSPAFRARLHGNLVRLEAHLAADVAADRARPIRRWAAILWPPRITSRGAAVPHHPLADPRTQPRRTRFPALGLPAALTLTLAFTLLTAAGLAFAAERSHPGDPLWPMRSAFVRWRTGRPPVAPESRGPLDGPSDPRPTAPPFRSIAVATIVRRTGQAPIATPGPVLPRQPVPAPERPIPRPTPPSTAPAPPTRPRPSAAPPVLALAERPHDDAIEPPRARPDRPVRSSATRDPGHALPSAVAAATLAATPIPATPTLPATAPATATSAPLPDTATLSGTVRLRDASVVAPLAGVTVALALVAADFPTGCDPLAPPAAVRTATTNADGDWSAAVPAGRWIIAVTGGCLGSQPHYLADFNGATAPTACAALALPVADGSAPSALVVVDIASAPGCGPVPTATP